MAANPPPSPVPPPSITNFASGETAWILPKNSSKSGSSISTPSVFDGAVRCSAAVSWKMGAPNPETTAYCWDDATRNKLSNDDVHLPARDVRGVGVAYDVEESMLTRDIPDLLLPLCKVESVEFIVDEAMWSKKWNPIVVASRCRALACVFSDRAFRYQFLC